MRAVVVYGCFDTDDEYRRCPNTVNLCIPSVLFCDGVDHCGSMADELQCDAARASARCALEEDAPRTSTSKPRADVQMRFALYMLPFVLIFSLALYLTIDTATKDSYNRRRFVEFFYDYYQITAEEVHQRQAPPLFSLARWKTRHRRGHEDASVSENGRFMDAKRRAHLWDGKTEPTESDEEEMAAVVRQVRQQRRLRNSSTAGGRHRVVQAKVSIFAPLISHMPATATSIQYRNPIAAE